LVVQSKEDISDCKGLRDVVIATKFWPKLTKNHKMAITLVVSDTSMHSLVLNILGLCYGEIHLSHSRTQGTK